MTEKRLPQVGEIWWTRKKKTAQVMSTSEHGEQPLKAMHDDRYCAWHTRNGFWMRDNEPGSRDLLHIHTNATGKVINPTFPGDTMKKQTQAPVDPFTVDWPKSAFKVGMDVMLKPLAGKEYESSYGIDCTKPQRIQTDDGSEGGSCFAIFCKHFRKTGGFVSTNQMVPFSEVEKYRAAIGQKPPKLPKPDPITQALEASRERTKDLEALQELTAKAKANKVEAKELAAKIKGLKEKVGMK